MHPREESSIKRRMKTQCGSAGAAEAMAEDPDADAGIGPAVGDAGAALAGGGGHADAAGRADDACLTGADDSFGFGRAASWCLSGELPPGLDLGGVTILRLLAAGGMGRVYEARQASPRRTVAVKVIREGVVSPIAAERLLREAQTLATLRHPHIALIHTCGTLPAEYGGSPFFVMELVDDARSITRFAASRAVSIRSRVALFRKVCEAVAHGHRHGVVHRDLKPANILVDAAGEPKVIDYGIAAGGLEQGDRVAASAGVVPPPTGACGAVLGTLRYMSPEQLLSPTDAADARSDVYALGLVLHELVAGRLPYDLAGMSVAEATRVLGRATAPGTGVVEAAVRMEEPKDDARALAVVVAKCLEPLAAERYATAADVAADLGRWLEGRAVTARPPTPLESLRRLARRHRVSVSVVAGLATALVAAVVAVSLLSVRLDAQRRAAEVARADAAAEATAAVNQLYASTVLLAAAARDRDNLPDARRLLDDARRLVRDGEPPIELACLSATLDDSLAALPVTEGAVTAVAWSPVGRWIVCGDERGVVRICDADAPVAAAPRTLATHAGRIWSLAFAADGRTVAVTAGDGSVVLHDVATGKRTKALEGTSALAYTVAFSADGGRLATASRDRVVRLWDVATGRETGVLRGHEGSVYAVAWFADGAAVATASNDGTLRIWDTESGRSRLTLRGHADRVFDVAVAPDGRRLASASEDGTVRLWDPATGRETACLRHPCRVNAVAFADGGDRIATAAADGVVRVWDVGRGVETAHLRGHAAAIWGVAWAPDGACLATAGADGTLRLWAADGRPDVVEFGGRVLSAAHAPDGALVAVGTENAEIHLRDAATLEDRGRLGPAMGRVHDVAWSPDGGLVAAACDDGAVFVWEAASRRRVVAVQAHTKRVYSVGFSADGRRLVSASEDRTVSVRDPLTGAVVGPTLPHPRRVFRAAFTPDGRTIATACEDRLVRLWDAATGAETQVLEGHTGPVNWVAFGPGGARIATASSDGTVRLWRTADGALERVLTGPAGQVWKAAFSPDGGRVAGAAADGTVHLWNASSGRPVLSLPGHRDQAWCVAFAPDGRSLISGSWDGTARAWGIETAEIVRRRAAAGR